MTGFGPFGRFKTNPASELAQASDCPREILKVTFDAVDEFVERAPFREYGALLMIGVNGKGKVPLLETVGRNRIGKIPDTSGSLQGPGPIEAMQPQQIAAPLWQRADLLTDDHPWQASTDAGDYLCNYLLYRTLQHHPGYPAGFLHIPPTEALPMDRQTAILKQLVALL